MDSAECKFFQLTLAIILIFYRDSSRRPRNSTDDRFSTLSNQMLTRLTRKLVNNLLKYNVPQGNALCNRRLLEIIDLDLERNVIAILYTMLLTTNACILILRKWRSAWSFEFTFR